MYAEIAFSASTKWLAIMFYNSDHASIARK